MTRRNGGDGQSIPAIPQAKEAATLKILNYLGRLDVFAPREIVTGSHLSHQAISPASHRTFAHIIIAVFLISLVSGVGQFYTYFQLAPTALRSSVIGLYSFALFYACAALALFKYVHRSTSLLSNSYAGLALVLTLGVHSLTGLAFSSPIVPLYFFIPAWAFLACSARAGVWWSAVVACVFVGIAAIEWLQLTTINIIPEHKVAGFWLSSALSSLALICFCLYSFQVSFLALTNQLDEDRLLYAHKARHDPLTGLANREEFDRKLQEALDQANRSHQFAALVYIDLNDFKAVNDTHGHQAGDSVLQIVARRIEQTVRDSDTIARLGGDEFGIVLPDLEDRNTVTRIVSQLEQTLARPMRMGELSITTSGSVGMAIAPDDGNSPSSLTRHADRNMYDAKSRRTRLKLVGAG